MTAPTQSPALAMREALELFVKATASAAGDDWDGVDQVARRMFERAHELANIALALPIPDEPAPGADTERLRKTLEQLLVWFKDKRLSQWKYMDDDFYSDLRTNTDYVERVLATSARPAPASEVDVMGLLSRIVHWGDTKCPCNDDKPNPCPLCGASVENLEPCKSAEFSFPRSLLADIRAAIAELQRGRG